MRQLTGKKIIKLDHATGGAHLTADVDRHKVVQNSYFLKQDIQF